MSAACAPLPEASRSSGRRTPQLPFERRDVALPEPPLPPLLEGRQQMLAREFVDGIRTHVEDLRHLFTVQIAVVPVEHRARSPRGMPAAIPRAQKYGQAGGARITAASPHKCLILQGTGNVGGYLSASGVTPQAPAALPTKRRAELDR